MMRFLKDLFSRNPKKTAVAGAVVMAMGFYGGGELQGFWAAGGGSGVPPTITFVGCTSDTTNTTVYTFTAHDVGTATATRATIVGVIGDDDAAVFGTASVTVGGDAATEVVDEDGTGAVNTAIYILTNTAGTAEDIVVTQSEAGTSVHICVWAASGLNSLTAVDTAVADDAAGATLDVSLDVSALGVAVGICIADDSGESSLWAGMTERHDASAEASFSAADYTEDASASTPLTATCNSTDSGEISAASASFR
jgi:hypothetical protein